MRNYTAIYRHPVPMVWNNYLALCMLLLPVMWHCRGKFLACFKSSLWVLFLTYSMFSGLHIIKEKNLYHSLQLLFIWSGGVFFLQTQLVLWTRRYPFYLIDTELYYIIYDIIFNYYNYMYAPSHFKLFQTGIITKHGPLSVAWINLSYLRSVANDLKKTYWD